MMNLLRIEQTYAKIGIDTTASKLKLNANSARISMHKTFPQIEIQTELPRVLIDQHECFATSGIKNNAEMLDEAAQSAQQQALTYTAKKAQDGDQRADLRNRGNVMADIARRDRYEQHEFNIGLMPKVGPQIEVVGSQNISCSEGQITNNYEEGILNIDATGPKISMYLREKPSINIQYIGSNIDVKV